MRRITLLLPLLILGPVACSVGVTGAPCASTDECPASEVCGEGGVCREKRDGEEGNCECMPGESQRCAADGTRVTCQDDPVCPFYPAGGGEASLTCECGPLGDSEGAGCDTPDAKICGNDAVLQCRQVGACLLWERTDDCGAQGLACEASAEGADPQCACPSNSTPTTLYVDPLHGNNPAEGVRPTGVQHPASCRFKRVTDALEALPDSRPATVVVTGFYREKWEKSRTYKQQDQVIPSTRNGWLYQATTRGESGTTEPTWPTVPSEQVTDGAIVWENVGPDAVHLKDEVFPLAVPSAVTLTTSDCPAGGGDACEPFKYALPFGPANGGDVATAAVSLADGSVFSGIAVVDDGAMTMASAVECSAGTATVEDAWLLGNGVGARGLTTGISAQGSCNVSVRRSVIGLVSGPGLASLTTGAVEARRRPDRLGLGSNAAGRAGSVPERWANRREQLDDRERGESRRHRGKPGPGDVQRLCCAWKREGCDGPAPRHRSDGRNSHPEWYERRRERPFRAAPEKRHSDGRSARNQELHLQ